MKVMMLPPPAATPDQPLGLERGGVFDAPWVGQQYYDAAYPTTPTNAPSAINVPPNRVGERLGFARLSVNGLGVYVTSPIGPSPVRPIQQARMAPTRPTPQTPDRDGIFASPFLSPQIDAAQVTDLARSTPEWVTMQEQAVQVTGPPPGVGQMPHRRGPWPSPLIDQSVFARYLRIP